MKKIVTFFAMAAFVVALSSCGGSKTAETTETTTDSMSTMESAPAEVTTEPAVVDTAVLVDTAAVAH